MLIKIWVLKDCSYWYYLNFHKLDYLKTGFLRIVVIGIIWTRSYVFWRGMRFLRIVVIGIIWTVTIQSPTCLSFLMIVVIGIIWTCLMPDTLHQSFLRIVVIGIIWTLKDYVAANLLGISFKSLWWIYPSWLHVEHGL